MTLKQATRGQRKFIRALHDHGPMTAKELASAVESKYKYTLFVVHALHEAGLIEKTLEGLDPSRDKRLAWRYKLAVPLESIEIKPQLNPSRRIPDEEVRYVAILRNGGMTGHELEDQFQKVYPDRPRSTIRSSVIPKAKRKGWCR